MNSSISELVVAVVSLILVVFGIVLAVVGLFFLSKLKRKNTQLVLFTHLSVSEGFISLFDITIIISTLYGYKYENSNFIQYLYIMLLSGASFIFYLLMTCITLDRLICVLSYKYKIYVTSKRVQFTVTCIWIVGVVSCVPFFFVQHFMIVCLHINIIFDITILIMSTIVFTVVLFRQHLKRGGVIPINRNKPTRIIGRNLVPFLIIITFIMFYTIPDFILMFVVVKSKNVSFSLMNVILCCWRIGLVVDPLCNLLLQKRIKREVFLFFKRIKCSIRKKEELRKDA